MKTAIRSPVYNLIGILAVMLLALSLALSVPSQPPALAQPAPICEIDFTIDGVDTVEVRPGETVSIEYRASISVSGILSALVSIQVDIPAGIFANYSPADQSIDNIDPEADSTYNVIGRITATVPLDAQPGQTWEFGQNTASVRCQGSDTAGPLLDSDTDSGFRIVAQTALPTSTPPPAATPTSPPTATSTATPSLSPTVTATPTPSATPTATATIPPTATPTASQTPTATSTMTPIATQPASSTATATASPASSPTATAPATATRTAIPTRTASPTSTTTATPTEAAEATATGTSTGIPAESPTPTAVSPSTSTPTSVPGPDGFVLEISEIRQEPLESPEGDADGVLRASLGILGLLALTGGGIGMWHGINRNGRS